MPGTVLAHGHDPINDSINNTNKAGVGGGEKGYLCQENSKKAREIKLNVAGIEDREQLFQLLNRMEKILWKVWWDGLH